MSNQLCLLCLQVINKVTTAKSSQKIRIETVCKLLTQRHPNYKSSHLSEFNEDEMCDFCEDCYPLFATMEEIKNQISLLEEQIGKQIQQIRDIILDGSSQLGSNGDDGREKIRQIRDMILSVTDNAEQQDENFVSDEVQVKVEHDDANPLGDVDDQFCDDNYNSHSHQPSVGKTNEEETDDLLHDEEDDDAAFCITPSNQKKSRRRCKSTNKKPPLRKRKIEDSLAESSQKSKIVSKRIKSESSVPASLRATRSSPRVTKQSVPPPSGVKTLVVSLKRINSASKKSTARSKPTSSSDKDGVPKTENDSKPTPKIKIKRKNDATLSPTNIPCLMPSCTATFRTLQTRDAHLKHSHDGFSPYQCQICKKKCRNQNRLAAHMVIKHEKGEKKFPCIKCGKSFCLEENLERHLKLHEVEEIKPIVCDVCDSRFENEEKLNVHSETHIVKFRFRCQYCGKTCQERKELERHERSHTKEKPEKCSHCEIRFADKVTLQRHVIRDHSSAPAANICHVCGKGFYLPADLKMHLDRHDGKYKSKCDKCGETFVNSNSCQSHRVKVHGEDPFVCDECGSSFTSLPGLRLHKKCSHEGVKKHKCQTCGACFVRADVFKRHTQIHKTERPYSCPHCPQAFKVKRSLTDHLQRIHTPGYVIPTPYKCPHCDKGFPFPFHLAGHIRQAHTGERPFSCDQCGKGFAIKSALTLHLKGAHGVVLEVKDRLPRSKKDVFQEEDANT
ncbi:zinc finger protein 425 isoform X2 [Folsomia candida]|uniref:zinc finger protein 425 isoform X2 n=1 Tax=Folsomia candida TaxID=158441 RepID=UPI0016055502|nr:zinc finger protein 425 isoform X2 [Folsomia candida]